MRRKKSRNSDRWRNLFAKQMEAAKDTKDARKSYAKVLIKKINIILGLKSINQYEIADYMDVSPTIVSHWFNHKFCPSKPSIRLLEMWIDENE